MNSKRNEAFYEYWRDLESTLNCLNISEKEKEAVKQVE